MSTVIGLFENLNQVEGAIYALKQAGIKSNDISQLGKEHITEEADQATRHTRAGRLFGTFGVIVGGYLGMAAIAGGSELFSYLSGTTINFLGIVLVLFVGAVVGALAGVLIGTKALPSILHRFGVLEDSKSSTEGHLNRNGHLVMVNTDEANATMVEKIMISKEVVKIETQRGAAPTLSPSTI